MRTTTAERMKVHRDSKRLGLRPVPVIVSEQEIDYLLTENAGAKADCGAILMERLSPFTALDSP